MEHTWYDQNRMDFVCQNKNFNVVKDFKDDYRHRKGCALACWWSTIWWFVNERTPNCHQSPGLQALCNNNHSFFYNIARLSIEISKKLIVSSVSYVIVVFIVVPKDWNANSGNLTVNLNDTCTTKQFSIVNSFPKRFYREKTNGKEAGAVQKEACMAEL